MKTRLITMPNWLEDCSNLYTRVVRTPEGVVFPDPLLDSTQEIFQVGDLNRLLHDHEKENIWRSWQLFSDKLCFTPKSYIPIIIDIDSHDQDLPAVYRLTCRCLDFLERNQQFVGTDRLRVIFSGKKGFHIEGRPINIVDNLVIRDVLLSELGKSCENLYGIKNVFKDGIIDCCQDHIRITGSLYSWMETSTLKRRRVIEFSVDEFRRTQVTNILFKSEES